MAIHLPKHLMAVLLISVSSFAVLAQVPECSDPAVRNEAKAAIEFGYQFSGYSPAVARPFVGLLGSLSEDNRPIAQRLKLAGTKDLKLRSGNDIRVCSIELSAGSGSFMLIVVARNPKPPRDIAAAAYNIGLPVRRPGADGASGWLLED